MLDAAASRCVPASSLVVVDLVDLVAADAELKLGWRLDEVVKWRGAALVPASLPACWPTLAVLAEEAVGRAAAEVARAARASVAAHVVPNLVRSVGRRTEVVGPVATQVVAAAEGKSGASLPLRRTLAGMGLQLEAAAVPVVGGAGEEWQLVPLARGVVAGGSGGEAGGGHGVGGGLVQPGAALRSVRKMYGKRGGAGGRRGGASVAKEAWAAVKAVGAAAQPHREVTGRWGAVQAARKEAEALLRAAERGAPSPEADARLAREVTAARAKGSAAPCTVAAALLAVRGVRGGGGTHAFTFPVRKIQAHGARLEGFSPADQVAVNAALYRLSHPSTTPGREEFPISAHQGTSAGLSCGTVARAGCCPFDANQRDAALREEVVGLILLETEGGVEEQGEGRGGGGGGVGVTSKRETLAAPLLVRPKEGEDVGRAAAVARACRCRAALRAARPSVPQPERMSPAAWCGQVRETGTDAAVPSGGRDDLSW